MRWTDNIKTYIKETEETGQIHLAQDMVQLAGFCVTRQ
jgi:hypothetical protein